jgi:hypothetical protein
MSPEPPSPWREFLRDVDASLPEPVTLHCLGGFVATIQHGLERQTADVDYVEIVPFDQLAVLQRLAGPDSPLARQHGLYFQHVTVASLPESYDDRLTALFPGRFRHLRLFAVEPHDLVLSKLGRNSPVDREDVAYLARTVPLDPGLLRTRYAQELRPITIGNLDRLDATLDLWIQAFFA